MGRFSGSLVLAIFLSAACFAQTRAIEVSGNYSILKVPYQHAHGVGMQASYDFSRRFGLDSGVTFYPADNHPYLQPAGTMFDFHTGLRFAAIHTRRFAIFAKARPGLIRFSDLRAEFPEWPARDDFPATPAHTVKYGPQINFSFDFGGTAEIYPSSRIFIRLDFGDQYIRFGEFIKGEVFGYPPVDYEVYYPAHAEHQYKMSIGAGWRLGGNKPVDEWPEVEPSENRRWTLGAHYVAFHLEPRTSAGLARWRQGVGLQVTRKLPSPLEWSTAANFYPSMVNSYSFESIGQPLFQFQSGLGANLFRYSRFNFKAHIRPGFLRHSDYLLPTVVGVESEGPKYEFSLNYGVGTEFDLWKRFPLQFEFSDNVVRTADVQGTFVHLRSQVVHAPQFTVGFGFRF